MTDTTTTTTTPEGQTLSGQGIGHIVENRVLSELEKEAGTSGGTRGEPKLPYPQVREILAQIAELTAQLPWSHPVKNVQWVPIDDVRANDYNPNSVPKEEMRLLHTSISEDGYTMPIVAIYDDENSTSERPKYVIVDGFHRYTTMRIFQDTYDTTGGYLPVVVIDKPLADRIASTVRHNRARGKHSVAGMGNLIHQMLMEGASDADIISKVGVDAEELMRLKHITGYSKLYAERENYSKVALTGTQMRVKAEFKKEHPDERIEKF
ncbi:ParB-like partition protein [Microbacterium phage Hendrix]|uniref:ParB-like nuclease domain protein n=1 Tax=Microbacterium phage Hendrix TaxID=2182341 RepID=A0A2U8UUC0_9CAUD|nr:ParB-like partition protein [Microbacterium phage Hendrix]AWN07672.1 ParB-like nuclease domain protein [Microbacterium phage Hendrix]